MSDIEKQTIVDEYYEYEKRDKHPLPFIIWLKHKKKIKATEFFSEE